MITCSKAQIHTASAKSNHYETWGLWIISKLSCGSRYKHIGAGMQSPSTNIEITEYADPGTKDYSYAICSLREVTSNWQLTNMVATPHPGWRHHAVLVCWQGCNVSVFSSWTFVCAENRWVSPKKKHVCVVVPLVSVFTFCNLPATTTFFALPYTRLPRHPGVALPAT